MESDNVSQYNKEIKRSKMTRKTIVLVLMVGALVLFGGYFANMALADKVTQTTVKPNEFVADGRSFEFSDDISTIQAVDTHPNDIMVANYLFGNPKPDVLKISWSPTCEQNLECGHVAVANINLVHRLLLAYRLLGYEPLEPQSGESSATIYLYEDALVKSNPRVLHIIFLTPIESSSTRVFAQESPGETVIMVSGTTGDNLLKASEKLALIALRDYKYYQGFNV
jgi:hypothetical protein